jgi:hypothetical protein
MFGVEAFSTSADSSVAGSFGLCELGSCLPNSRIKCAGEYGPTDATAADTRGEANKGGRALADAESLTDKAYVKRNVKSPVILPNNATFDEQLEQEKPKSSNQTNTNTCTVDVDADIGNVNP